jgi:transposase-like protein
VREAGRGGNSPENLVVVTRAEHRRLHSTTKWKRWTSEEKARARELHAGGVSIQDVSRMMGRGFSSTIRHVCNRRGAGPVGEPLGSVGNTGAAGVRPTFPTR